MGVFKQILHSLAGIWEDVKAIKKCQDPMLTKKAERFDEINRSLKNARFNVVRIYPKTDSTGETEVFVEYRAVGTIKVEPHGEDIYSDNIVAINMLNLISYEDMVRIAEEVQRQKQV